MIAVIFEVTPKDGHRDAYLAIKDLPPREKLVVMEVEVEDADASGGEPVFAPDGTPAGRVSSGGYGYSVGKSLALCLVKAELLEAGDKYTIAVLGKPHSARVLPEPPFDPKGLLLRQ